MHLKPPRVLHVPSSWPQVGAVRPKRGRAAAVARAVREPEPTGPADTEEEIRAGNPLARQKPRVCCLQPEAQDAGGVVQAEAEGAGTRSVVSGRRRGLTGPVGLDVAARLGDGGPRCSAL